MVLQVGIVGAGIGGLSVAIALRRAGAHVEIYEKSYFRNEIGAAITITPNGMRVLKRWGFDEAVAHAVEAKQLRLVDPQSLQDRFVESFREVPGDYGAKFMFFHRVDLHNALRNMAEAKDSQPGVPVTIHTGKPVAQVDCENGTLTLEDGTAVKKDLVVIADGIQSRFVSTLTGQETSLEDTGSSFYRCLIPVDQINQDPELRTIWKDKDPGFWVPFDLATNFYLVSYPCRNGTVMNIAMRHTNQTKDSAHNWNTETPLDDVLATVKGQSPLLEKLVKMTTSSSVHRVYRREPLARYSRGRAVIIGDAAHPIQPTHAQGAVLAIEEASALEVLLDNVNDTSQVSQRLEMYDDLMKQRLQVTQLLSDATPGLVDQFRDRAESLWDGEVYPHTAMNFSKPIRDFFYSYDVHAEAKKYCADIKN